MPSIELSNKIVSLLLNGLILLVMLWGGIKSYTLMEARSKAFEEKFETIGSQVKANYAFHSKAISNLTLRLTTVETERKVADNELGHIAIALNRLEKSVNEALREVRGRNAPYQLYRPEPDTGGQK